MSFYLKFPKKDFSQPISDVSIPAHFIVALTVCKRQNECRLRYHKSSNIKTGTAMTIDNGGRNNEDN